MPFVKIYIIYKTGSGEKRVFVDLKAVNGYDKNKCAVGIAGDTVNLAPSRLILAADDFESVCKEIFNRDALSPIAFFLRTRSLTKL